MLPIAHTMRPRFGSEAKNAVLTSGECAMPKATRRQSSTVRPPSTRIAMNLVAPSPSRTIACASSTATASIAARSAGRRGSSARAIGAIGALPVAASTKLSLVDVSPSTVAPLNDTSATSRSSGCRTARATGASVAMNASIVAMSGWIMPAPFAMPVTVTVAPSIVACRDAPLGTVSVVMIAFAASNQPSARALARAAGSAATSRSTGSGSMITPVEYVSTSCSGQARIDAKAAAVVAASATPRSPVPAFALPALTTSPRSRPLAARCARQSATGAAWKRFCVNTPAASVPGSQTTTSTSSRSQFLMRAAAVPRATPGTGRSAPGAGGV